MKKTIYSVALLFFTAFVFTITSCVKDPKPDPVVEQEEFDHVLLQYIKLNADGSETTDTTSVNFNKEGVPAPGQITLDNGTSYRMLITISLKGESINNEIIDEGTEHRFFLLPSQDGILNYVYNDEDADGRGIGLDGKLSVTGTGTFTLKIILRHALDKSNSAAQAWNSPNYYEAGGEDDLNVTFGVKAE